MEQVCLLKQVLNRSLDGGKIYVKIPKEEICIEISLIAICIEIPLIEICVEIPLIGVCIKIRGRKRGAARRVARLPIL